MTGAFRKLMLDVLYAKQHFIEHIIIHDSCSINDFVPSYTCDFLVSKLTDIDIVDVDKVIYKNDIITFVIVLHNVNKRSATHVAQALDMIAYKYKLAFSDKHSFLDISSAFFANTNICYYDAESKTIYIDNIP